MSGEMIDPPRRVTQAEFDHQRANGWPDFHPEDYCHRCGGPNIVWHVAADVWNVVMRPDGEGSGQWNEIICPACFLSLASDGTISVELVVQPGRMGGDTLLQRARDHARPPWSPDGPDDQAGFGLWPRQNPG